MILIVKLDENMPPLMVEALKHNILAAPGVQGVEWQEAAQPSVQRTATPAEKLPCSCDCLACQSCSYSGYTE